MEQRLSLDGAEGAYHVHSSKLALYCIIKYIRSYQWAVSKMAKIHYIWAGVVLPDSYVHNILYLLRNSLHDIYLWTDRVEANRSKLLDIAGYNVANPSAGINARLHVCDLQLHPDQQQLRQNLTPTEYRTLIQCVMIEHPQFCDRYAAHINLEDRNKFGNLATLSDVMRLVILYFEGGVYIDCDNNFQGQLKPGQTPEEVLSRVYEKDLYEEAGQWYRVYKTQPNLEVTLSNQQAFYSWHARFGNSVLACQAGAIGCLQVLKNTLQAIILQNTTSTPLEYMKARPGSLLETHYNTLNKKFDAAQKQYGIDKTPGQFRRYGKSPGLKLKDVHASGAMMSGSFGAFSYPFAWLAMKIGPEVVDVFEKKSPNSEQLPDSGLFSHICCCSDQTWL